MGLKAIRVNKDILNIKSISFRVFSVKFSYLVINKAARHTRKAWLVYFIFHLTYVLYFLASFITKTDIRQKHVL